MIVGFVGAGNMAAAMARGWAGQLEGMLFTDSGSGRAAQLADEVGGKAVQSNAELARAADLVVLALKPAGLDRVTEELAAARGVLSILGATSMEALRSAFPESSVFRAMPNLAVEIRQGVLCLVVDDEADPALAGAVRGMLGGLGHVVELQDAELNAATAVMGCSPAYFALAVEAIADAGAEAGLDCDLARELVVETTAGTAALLRRRHPADVRRAVASPGGSTEAGLAALDREKVSSAFAAAVRASLERMEG